MVIVDSKAPVSFFAYPDKLSDLVPEGCRVQLLAAADDDAEAALEALVYALGAGSRTPALPGASRPDLPSGALDPEAIARTIGALLPQGAIVADEGNTAGVFVPFLSAGAPPHSWLCLTGGAIGQGMPLAVGAAVACPSRKVVSLEADGSAMYTLQALWTQAREQLDVTTVILQSLVCDLEHRVESSRRGSARTARAVDARSSKAYAGLRSDRSRARRARRTRHNR